MSAILECLQRAGHCYRRCYRGGDYNHINQILKHTCARSKLKLFHLSKSLLCSISFVSEVAAKRPDFTFPLPPHGTDGTKAKLNIQLSFTRAHVKGLGQIMPYNKAAELPI